MIKRLNYVFEFEIARYMSEGAAPVDFEYFSAPVWEFNQLDTTEKNVSMFWSLPTTLINKVMNSGVIEERYLIELFFLEKGDIVQTQDARTIYVDRMWKLAEDILNNYVGTNAAVGDINKKVYEDVYNFNDINWDGVRVTFEMKFIDNC